MITIRYYRNIYFYFIIILSIQLACGQISDDFSPSVTARCDRGVMYINVVTVQAFDGVVHVNDFRRSPCLAYGNGGFNTTLKVSLLADENDEIYCGVKKEKGQRSVSLSVRAHKSLELSEDKNYFLTCEHTGYKNVRGGTYRVTLRLVDSSGQRVHRTVHGMSYTLRAELTPSDSITSLRLKNCFAFSDDTEQVLLIDEFGCPTKDHVMSGFTYNSSHLAEALIYEMFKYPETNKINIQCDAVLCRGGCQEPQCDDQNFKGRDLALDGYSQMSASTQIIVFEPSDEELTLENLAECTEWRFPWLITLCIVLAILLLLMLLLNMFMCSSLTCRCIKTDLVEQEPSETEEEYDPYRADWTAPNSHYGSRYSLNRADNPTLRSNKSGKSHSMSGYDNDHYTPDHFGRPQSRYSTHSMKSQKSPKTIEIDYTNENVPYQYSRH